MATAKPEPKGADVRHHPLVAKLAGDPANPPHRLVRLVGYPGASPVEGTTRLWLNLDFTQYVDIPDEKIAHCEDGVDDKPSTLFVAKGTKLEFTSVSSTDVEAEFLSGAIAAASLQETAASERAFDFHLPIKDRIDVNRFMSVRCGFVTRQFQSCIFFCPDPSELIFCNNGPTQQVFCETILQPHCFQETPRGIPDLGSPVFVEIGRQVLAAAGLNPQPLPPAGGPLTRPAG